MNYKDLIEKTAVSRDEDTDVRFMRDKFIPGAKRLPLNMAGQFGGMVVGAKLGLKSQNPMTQLYGGALGGVVGSNLASAAQRQYALNKLSKKYTGEGPSASDMAKVHGSQLATLLLGSKKETKALAGLTPLIATPEAVIQKRRRQMAEAENTRA